MGQRASFASLSILGLQCAGAAMLIGAITILPPTSGRMLLLPVLGQEAGATLATAMAVSDTTLPLARGPVAGSVIVTSSSIGAWALLKRGIVTLAAPAAICGDEGLARS